MSEEAQRTQKEWLLRERKKLKDRIEIAEDDYVKEYLQKELSRISARILKLGVD